MRRLADQGRTVLVVSHRLRLAETADVVAVLDAGRIVETGTPADLAGRDGPYRRLLASVDDTRRMTMRPGRREMTIVRRPSA